MISHPMPCRRHVRHETTHEMRREQDAWCSMGCHEHDVGNDLDYEEQSDRYSFGCQRKVQDTVSDAKRKVNGTISNVASKAQDRADSWANRIKGLGK